MHGNRKYRVRNSSNATRNCRNQNKAECSIKAARRISLIIHTLLASLLFHRKITAVPFTPVRGYGKQTNMASTNQMIHSSRGTPVVEDGTLQRIVGTAMDVTDHELLTRELRRREAYLAEAQRLSHTGSFGWNISTGEIFWSDETFRIFEFAPSSKVSLPMILERVHPQDMPSVKMAIAAATRGEGIDLEHQRLNEREPNKDEASMHDSYSQPNSSNWLGPLVMKNGFVPGG
jgi:PAS domain-containing protein